MQKANFKKDSPAKTPLTSANDPSMNRKTPRRSYERLVGVMIRGKYEVYKANQIGEGGMMIELPASLKSGEWILVTLILPMSLVTIVGRAEVLYKKAKVSDVVFQTGLKFINLETSKRRAIRDFVSAKPALDNKEDRGKGKSKLSEALKIAS